MAKDRLGLLLALGGLAVGVGGAIYLARHQGKVALGRVVTGRAARPPLVGERSEGGMRVRHYRSARMPIEQRVRLIQDRVWEGIQDPRMRKLALAITKNCPERDGLCEAKAVYNYVKSRTRYTGDIAPVAMGAGGPVESVDLFQSAQRTLEFGGGDCDDHVALGAVLMSLNGIETRLRVTAERVFADWGHIYPVVGLPKTAPTKWIAADTTLPGSRFGVEVPFGKNLDYVVKDVPA